MNAQLMITDFYAYLFVVFMTDDKALPYTCEIETLGL